MEHKPYKPSLRYKTVVTVWKLETWAWDKIDKFFFWLTEKTWGMK